MSKVRLSFVLPVFEPDINILSKCVKSLSSQSFKDWEAIFVLDGEDRDAARTIKSALKGCQNYTRIVEIPHSGAQKTRNHGFTLTDPQADFVCFLDSDCVIEPESAYLWVKEFDKSPDVDFVYGSYKFLGERGAINAEPFDEFTLRVRNYISGCFPMRRSMFPGWKDGLKSLQDWDLWLSIIDNGGKGRMLPGYHFSTAYPTTKSISGEGCTDEVWLSRVDAVKKLHNLPERNVCVSSLTCKHEGIWLAKVMGADYQDFPNSKPHRYGTILQLGFRPTPDVFAAHASIFDKHSGKKFVYLLCDDIVAIRTLLNWEAIKKFGAFLRSLDGVFVEDKAASESLSEMGISSCIVPLPMAVGGDVPLPDKKRFAVDIHPNYSPVFNVIQRSLPDVELVPLDGAKKLSEFCGLVHFHPDKSVSIGLKRAALAGRHIVSNVQSPFMGYVDDTQKLEGFIPSMVDKIRRLAYSSKSNAGRDFYSKAVSPEALQNAIS